MARTVLKKLGLCFRSVQISTPLPIFALIFRGMEKNGCLRENFVFFLCVGVSCFLCFFYLCFYERSSRKNKKLREKAKLRRERARRYGIPRGTEIEMEPIHIDGHPILGNRPRRAGMAPPARGPGVRRLNVVPVHGGLSASPSEEEGGDYGRSVRL